MTDTMLADDGFNCSPGYLCQEGSQSPNPVSGRCNPGHYCPAGTTTEQECQNILLMINVKLKKWTTARNVRQVTIVVVKQGSPNSQIHCVVLLDLIVKHKLVPFFVLVVIIVRWGPDGNKFVHLVNIKRTKDERSVNNVQKVFIVTHMSLELEPA